REFGNLSVRSNLTYWDITSGNNPSYLWTLFLPNYFGGLNDTPKWYQSDLVMNYVFLTVPRCLLALLGLIETLRRRNFFWLGVVLLITELSFGRFGFLATALYHTPVLNLFRQMTLFFDLAHFGLCLMAAIGAQALFSRTLPKSVEKRLPFYLGLGFLL